MYPGEFETFIEVMIITQMDRWWAAQHNRSVVCRGPHDSSGWSRCVQAQGLSVGRLCLCLCVLEKESFRRRSPGFREEHSSRQTVWVAQRGAYCQKSCLNPSLHKKGWRLGPALSAFWSLSSLWFITFRAINISNETISQSLAVCTTCFGANVAPLKCVAKYTHIHTHVSIQNFWYLTKY